eukprot:scaffold29862_cov51-Phaeocystis_antarctica.AAC.3
MSTAHQVDDANVVGAEANRQLDARGVELELLDELRGHVVGVGALAVELVDKGDPRHVVAAHLPVDRDRLRLDARHAAQHEDRTVEHAQRPLHLDREVDVARRVDDIDGVLVALSCLPAAVRRRRLDGDALLSLELHGVHRRANPVLAAHLVDGADPASEVEDTLRQRRLARVDVSRDPDVTELLHRDSR